MILLLYNLALLVALFVASPWWLWRMLTRRKYRASLAARLGLEMPAHLASRKSLDASQPKPVIWIHAVSVGEVLAVSRLVGELDQQLPEYHLMISTTTETGQQLAQQRFGIERVFYCPLDLPWATRTMLQTLRPSMLVLAESEFWPNLLAGCMRRRIPVVVVNARISDRSWPRYRQLSFLWRRLLRHLRVVLAQSEIDAARLRALGCPHVETAGNLKFDVVAPAESEANRLLSVLGAGLQFVVAGSTLEGEESALLAAWPEVLAAAPETVLVLAPRHPERFAAVAALLAMSGCRWRRRSEPTTNPLAAGEVVLLDSIGELASLYALAQVAFIGGSLVPAGGHNPLEPARFAVPIVMGPSYENFRAIGDSLIAADGLIVSPPEALGSTLARLLTDKATAQGIGKNAQCIFEAQAGATARAVSVIGEILRGSQR